MMGVLIGVFLLPASQVHGSSGFAPLGAQMLVAALTGASLCAVLGETLIRRPKSWIWGCSICLLPLSAFGYTLVLESFTPLISEIFQSDTLPANRSAPGFPRTIVTSAGIAFLAISPLPFGVFLYPSFAMTLLWARQRLKGIARATRPEADDPAPHS